MRALGPNVDGLELGVHVLEIFVSFAPNGFPTFVQMRDVWLDLDQEYNALDKSSIGQDVWRCMFKHCVELSNREAHVRQPGINDMLASIQVEYRDPNAGSDDVLDNAAGI